MNWDKRNYRAGSKYGFEGLEVGEEKYYEGPASRVKAALGMWTKRQGKLKKFKTALDGLGLRIKRIA